MLLLGLVFWGLLVGRLAKLQLLDHATYLEYADREHWGRAELPAERGAILDRHHRLLSHNVMSHSLVARAKAMPEAAALEARQIVRSAGQDSRGKAAATRAATALRDRKSVV